MPTSIFDGCSDACGWMAAIVCVLSFGSFGVPIKHISVEVHPLVMQSYKTLVCFVTSWFVILLGEEVRWSNWGVVSGLFWVPGAACGIYGIRNAGLAVAVGTWSSIIVLTSFLFGFILFQEQIRDFGQTCMAFLFLILGLIGMSRYSAHPTTTTTTTTAALHAAAVEHSAPHQLVTPLRTHPDGRKIRRSNSNTGNNGPITVGDKSSSSLSVAHPSTATAGPLPTSSTIHAHHHQHHHHHLHHHHPQQALTGVSPMEIEPLFETASAVAADSTEADIMDGPVDSSKDRSSKDRIIFWGGRISLTRRQLGILGAVINGAWGGMNLIPLHFAQQQEGLSGAGYVISYAGGSLIVNTIMWILYFAYYLHQKKGSMEEAFECMPSWHLAQLWQQGLAAGLLYSLGNFTAILAVTFLGQGTGFSFCQMQLFVSGLWGVFYFREIKGTEIIVKWFASAFIAVTGIIWLSYEHVGGTAGHR